MLLWDSQRYCLFVCLRLLMAVLYSKQKKIYIYKQNYTLSIKTGTSPWNLLKKSIADSLQKWYFRRHTNISNSLSRPHHNWTSTLSKKHKTRCYSIIQSLRGYHQSQERVRIWDSLVVWDSTVALNKYKAMSSINFSLFQRSNRWK